MVISIPGGKLIATMHEVMVKFDLNNLTLQAKTDDLILLEASRILVANGGGVIWSLSLGSEETVRAFVHATGIATQ